MAPGSPPPAPVPAALPPLSAGIKGEALLSWPRDPRPWPTRPTPAPQLTWKPQPSGPQPGRVRGQLCQSTSRAHTLPAMPWIMGREGSRGRNTTPWFPHPTPHQPTAARGSLEKRGQGRGLGPFMGKETSTPPFSRRCPRSALSGLHGPGGGEQGAWLGSFTPSFPE